MVEFVDIEPVSSSIIMVVGVGGGGSNAVNHMFRLGITDVSFMVCNTDRQALDRSPVPNKIRLGEGLTAGLGAGNRPERGRAAAEESIEEVKEMFRENNIRMVFVTAGMGGGTGTGAAPVIARAAKDMGILTVAIVTIPFQSEGPKRIRQAVSGIAEISKCVDSLLVVNNENIHEIYGDLTLSDAFGKADDILATAAKSIAEIITVDYQINVDFADVQAVMTDSGIALMGSAIGSGENRALEVAQMAISSPLLNHRDIAGAKNVLLNITSGTKEITLSETVAITEFIQEHAANQHGTDLIWGAGKDETLGDSIRVTVIATGFDIESIPSIRERYAPVLDGKPVQKNIVSAAPAEHPRTVVVLGDDTEAAPAKPKEPEAVGDFSVQTRSEATPEPAGPVHTYYNREPQTPVSTPEPVPVAAVEFAPAEQPEPVAEPSSPRSITSYSEEELENVPAYVRRRMKVEAAAPTGKISRETLTSDSAAEAPRTVELF